ncbi:MAG: amidase [Acidimicrobiales bacterium]
MQLTDYLRLDATDLAAAVRAGDADPADIQARAFEQYEATHSSINAVVEWFDDPTPIQNAEGPLAGVPFLLKDYGSSEKGRLVQMGSRLGLNNRARHTAGLVDRLLNAGAQILGRTACPEFVQHGATETALNGLTRHPLNAERSPGGSSGGAGAAIARGVVPAAHGSDCAGSIRIPASTCGLVGLKPGLHRVRLDDGGWGGIANEFVLTRTVRDSRLFLDILGDGPYSPAPERPLRIAMDTTHWARAAEDPEVVAASTAAADSLRLQGHEVETITTPVDYERLMGTFFALFHRWIVHDVNMLVAAGGVEGDDTLEPLTRKALAHLRELTMEEITAAQVAGGEITMRLERELAGFDVFLTPTLGRTEIPLGALAGTNDDLDEYIRLNDETFPYSYLFNVSGWPSISVPGATSAAGMPIGVQLSAPLGSEHLLLDVAHQLMG